MGLDKQVAMDPQVLRNLMVGAGAGLGTYALSSILPGARHNRFDRLLASLGVGVGAGYFGNEIRNWLSNRFGRKPAAPAVSSADAKSQPVEPVKAPEMKLEQKPAEKPDKGDKIQTPNMTIDGKADKKD